MALPSREDGRTDDWNEARDRRGERGGGSRGDACGAALSGSMGDSKPALTSALASHYSRFRVTKRVLLTGHSHQAWPDVGYAAQQRAWLDAAELVDDKWERASEQATRVREGFARLLGDAAGN